MAHAKSVVLVSYRDLILFMRFPDAPENHRHWKVPRWKKRGQCAWKFSAAKWFFIEFGVIIHRRRFREVTEIVLGDKRRILFTLSLSDREAASLSAGAPRPHVCTRLVHHSQLAELDLNEKEYQLLDAFNGGEQHGRRSDRRPTFLSDTIFHAAPPAPKQSLVLGKLSLHFLCYFTTTYTTPLPFPCRTNFPCATNIFKYRLAVASETCSNFSTSSFVISFFWRACAIIFSRCSSRCCNKCARPSFFSSLVSTCTCGEAAGGVCCGSGSRAVVVFSASGLSPTSTVDTGDGSWTVGCSGGTLSLTTGASVTALDATAGDEASDEDTGASSDMPKSYHKTVHERHNRLKGAPLRRFGFTTRRRAGRVRGACRLGRYVRCLMTRPR